MLFLVQGTIEYQLTPTPHFIQVHHKALRLRQSLYVFMHNRTCEKFPNKVIIII